MRHKIIQHNKICLSKYLYTENQVQEEETMRKVFKGNAQFVQKVTFELLMDCKAGNSSWKYYKSCYF